MKTKRSRLIITVLSVAAIGLSSAALQAQGDQQQMRHSNMWGQNLEGVELSQGLQDMVNEFRQTRERLMEQYREIHIAFRAEMAPLILELKALEQGTPEFEAKLGQIEALRAEHRNQFGLEFREARVQLRDMKRQLREQIRAERPEAPPAEG